MEGILNELGEEELTMMGLTVAMLELRKSQHRGVVARSRLNAESVYLHELNLMSNVSDM